MNTDFLESVLKQLEYYKSLGEKTFSQVTDADLNWQYNPESNSIFVLVKHLSGNMLSRWTDFLTSDGEKSWRDRDDEFIGTYQSREDMLHLWDKGWSVFLTTLRSLSEQDLQTTIYIRNEGHTVLEAVNRQLAHYCYHVGQIVYIGKMLSGEWKALSIARGLSREFNNEKFSEEKQNNPKSDY